MRIELTVKQFEDAMDFAHKAGRVQMQMCEHLTTDINVILVDIDAHSYSTLKEYGIL